MLITVLVVTAVGLLFGAGALLALALGVRAALSAADGGPSAPAPGGYSDTPQSVPSILIITACSEKKNC